MCGLLLLMQWLGQEVATAPTCVCGLAPIAWKHRVVVELDADDICSVDGLSLGGMERTNESATLAYAYGIGLDNNV